MFLEKNMNKGTKDSFGFHNWNGGFFMARVQNIGEKYRCEWCGNEIEVTAAGGGELRCCGYPMKRLGRY